MLGTEGRRFVDGGVRGTGGGGGEVTEWEVCAVAEFSCIPQRRGQRLENEYPGFQMGRIVV